MSYLSRYGFGAERSVVNMCSLWKVAMDTSSDMPLDTRVDYLEKAKGSARMAAQVRGDSRFTSLCQS